MVSFDTILADLNIFLIKIAAAIIILLFGFIIGRFLSKLSHKILREIEIDKIIANTVRLKIPIADLVALFIQIITYSAAIILSLNQFGIGIKFLYFIIGLIIIIALVLLVTTIKDVIPNLISGEKVKRKFQRGDKIKIDKIEGTVIEVTKTDVRIVTKEKDFMSLPNSYVTKKLKF